MLPITSVSHLQALRQLPGGQRPVVEKPTREQERSWEFMLQSGQKPSDPKEQMGFLKFLCRQLESSLINTVLSTARNAMPESGLFSGGSAGSMYRSLSDEQSARDLANAGGFGLGDALFRQIAAHEAYARVEQAEPTEPERLAHEEITQADLSAPKGGSEGSDK